MEYYYSTRRRDPNSPHYGLVQITPPAAEPVLLADAKLHVRQDITDDDAYITTLIQVARAHVENWIGQRLITQTWNLILDDFPIGSREIIIPYGPVQSVASVTYIDSGGTLQTYPAPNYTLDVATFVARLYPIYSLIWPITRYQRNAITVQYTTGYGAAGSNCPQNIVHAIKMLVAHWYEQREILVESRLAPLPQAVEALLSAERASWL